MLPLSQAELLGEAGFTALLRTSCCRGAAQIHSSHPWSRALWKQLREQQRDIRQLSAVTSGFFILLR